ncbi:efflux RND transporter periplasmic adaptor subunit, partial [bacterium]|nr:efflux RND transporter periplasmic adaptor subunit [bacterium]
MLKKSLFILLLVILSLSGCGKKQEEAHEEKEAVQENSNPNVIRLDDVHQKNIDIQLSPAKESSVQETVRLMGKIEPDQTRTAHIRPLAAGKIIEVHVRAGDRVKTGSPLLTYDNIELGDLMGEYREALAEVEVANKALERAKKLVDLGSISRAEFDRREAEHRNATAKVE